MHTSWTTPVGSHREGSNPGPCSHWPSAVRWTPYLTWSENPLQASLTLPAAGCWLWHTTAGSLDSRHSFCKSEMRSADIPSVWWFMDVQVRKRSCPPFYSPLCDAEAWTWWQCSVPRLHPNPPVPFTPVKRPIPCLCMSCWGWVVQRRYVSLELSDCVLGQYLLCSEPLAVW